MVSKTPNTSAVATSTHCDDNVVSRKDHSKEKPLFIPPRKRQASKKTNGVQNYVDHIVNVQNRQKLSPSNVAAGLEDDLIKTSLILKNKQPLPAIPMDTITSNEVPYSQQQREKISTSQTSIGCPEGDNEMCTLDLTNCSAKSPAQRYESSTVTPSSYSESSLDVKLGNYLSHRSSSKKRVNIRTDIMSHSNRNSPDIANYEVDLESGETSGLNEDEHSLEHYHVRRTLERNNCNSSSTYLTLTGTIKRGRKKGECMDLQINMSREELERINAAAIDIKKEHNMCCICSWTAGLHIFLLSLICLPIVVVISAIYSFYIGTLTWYNMFNFFNEEKSCIYRFIMSPILILAYPVAIIMCTLGLGIYAGFAQLNMQFYTWLNEIADIEKGFYGWLCSFLHLSDCSPYEVVVILTDINLPHDPSQLHVNTSTEELSL